MAAKYTWLIIAIITLLFSFMFAFVYYTPTEGFQDKTDPELIKIIQNLFKSYMGLSSKIKAMGVESKEIEGTTLDKFVETQMNSITTIGKNCTENICTDEQIKNPEFLRVYNAANALGELGLSEITFDTLVVAPVDGSSSSEQSQQQPAQGQAAQEQPTQGQMGPETQLPAAQMPASVISSSVPSLDACKKHYKCNISTNME